MKFVVTCVNMRSEENLIYMQKKHLQINIRPDTNWKGKGTVCQENIHSNGSNISSGNSAKEERD